MHFAEENDYINLLCSIMKENEIYVNNIEPIIESKLNEPSYIVRTDKKKYFAKFSLSERFSKQDFEQLSKINDIIGDTIQIPILSVESSYIKRQINIYEWVDGENLRFKLSKCSNSEYNKYGYESGKVLKSIHQVPYENPPKKFNILNQTELCLQYIKESGFQYLKPFDYHKYLEHNIGLLCQKECSFIHLDYKPKNLIHTNSGRIVVVDLDSSCAGDPWIDFYDKAFSMYEKKELFNSALIKGYFNNNIPNTFWEYFKVLSVFSLIQNTVWLLRKNNINQIHEMESYLWNSYDGFKLKVPRWF